MFEWAIPARGRPFLEKTDKQIEIWGDDPMIEKTFETQCGTIHYWISKDAKVSEPSLVFLPGLTADHRLFNKQIEYFEGNHVGIRKETDARNYDGLRRR